jgi:Mg/Co/Ni transporter MgtE
MECKQTQIIKQLGNEQKRRYIMKIINNDASIENFEAWSGGKDTKETILEAGKADEFDALIEELYPDGIDETALNDLLWFESKWIFESLGITEDDEEEEDNNENE